MAGAVPEEEVTVPMATMRWERIAFLHWAYPPAHVEAVLPAGLEADTFDGMAWVSVTPFVMGGVRPVGLPPIPGVSTFPETNLRTYVRRPDGIDGLWFLSLDATRSAALAARAAIGTPYCWSDMRVTSRGDEIAYTTRRRRFPRDGGTSRITVAPGDPLLPDERDHWLTGRWRAYSRAHGRLWCTPVEHEPWPLQSAEVRSADLDLALPVGLPPPAGDPVVHWSPGVHVRMGPPRPVR